MAESDLWAKCFPHHRQYQYQQTTRNLNNNKKCACSLMNKHKIYFTLPIFYFAGNDYLLAKMAKFCQKRPILNETIVGPNQRS
jgi:hypothetical protein